MSKIPIRKARENSWKFAQRIDELTKKVRKLEAVIHITAVGGALTYTAFGLKMSLTQWAAYSDIKRETIAKRIRKGWKIERAVSESATVGNNQYLRY